MKSKNYFGFLINPQTKKEKIVSIVRQFQMMKISVLCKCLRLNNSIAGILMFSNLKFILQNSKIRILSNKTNINFQFSTLKIKRYCLINT